MKSGWLKKTLGELLEKTETTNPLQKPEKEFDYIDVSSISNQSFRIEETQRLKGKDAPSRARRLVKVNDIIFATIRPTLQRIAIVPEELDHQVCSTGYFVLRPKPMLDHRFVFYSLFTEEFMGNMASLQKGASYPAVTDAEVRAQTLSFPSLLEQHRIVAILDEAFDGIATARANAEKNLQNVRSLFESHLQAVFSQRGEGWKDKMLKEITSHLGYGLHGTPKYTEDGEYYFVNGNNLDNGKIVFKESTKRVSVAEYEKHKKRLSDRTVLVSINGTLGNIAFYNDEKIILGKSACYFNLIDGVNKHFIKYIISSPYFLEYAHREATGATIKNVSLKSMREFKVPLPSLTEQNEIVRKLDCLSKESLRLESIYQQKLAALDELKKSLLRQAFSGQL